MGEAPTRPFGVRLKVAYDGTEFHGWQVQPRHRTVQSVLEDAIDAMAVDRSRVRGCSRTDSGVHAEGQIASFAAHRELPERGWLQGLNGLLPEDVAIVEARHCDRRYNPRYDAARKLYRYRVTVGPSRDPLTRRVAWYLGPSFARRDRQERRPVVEDYFDLAAMEDAARRMVGEHDFRAFRASTDDREYTRRTMFAVDIRAGYGGRPTSLAIEVEGNAFMKNMVRILAGTLLEVGRHRVPPEHIDRLLGPEGRREDAGPTAPAHGLSLVRIDLRHGDWHKKRHV